MLFRRVRGPVRQQPRHRHFDQSRVKFEKLPVIPSAVPDRKAISRFTKLVSPMLKLCQQIRLQIQNLRQTRDLLLPRMLSGQVELETY